MLKHLAIAFASFFAFASPVLAACPKHSHTLPGTALCECDTGYTKSDTGACVVKAQKNTSPVGRTSPDNKSSY